MTIVRPDGSESGWSTCGAAITTTSSGRHQAGAVLQKLSRLLWYDRPVRWQLLATVVLINLVAATVTGFVVIYNAHKAATVEVAAAMEVAEQLVRKTVDRLAQDINYRTSYLEALEDLPLHLRHLRHVRILVADANGRRYRWSAEQPAHRNGDSDADAKAPRWFRALFTFDNPTRQVPVTLSGRHIGTVFLIGQPAHEIAEVWQDVSDLSPIALIANLLVIGLFYIALGRILNPLTSLGTGLRKLEQGRFRHRLPRPKAKELADIVVRFNTLASALEAARTDNAQLNRRLVTAQDDERRQIATELHDEMGACLFALRANVLSVQRLIDAPFRDVAELMRKRAETLVEVTGRIQTTNRRLLRTLRPMAIGQAPLADVIAGLIADFERSDSDHAFKFDVGHIGRSYGDCIDLTVYRCVQEGVTNAARHAQAKTVVISLDETRKPVAYSDTGAPSNTLRLSVRDDGHGYVPGTRAGLGLAGMEERVRALGGVFSISRRLEGGTSLVVAIPVEEAERKVSTHTGSERQ